MQLVRGDGYAGTVSGASTSRPTGWQEWTQRQSLVRGMLDRNTPAPQQRQVQKSLTQVDSQLLSLARSQGVTIGVVSPGQDVFRLGALQPRSLEDYQRALPAMQQQALRAIGAVTSPALRAEQIDKVLDGTGLGAIRFAVPLSSVEMLDKEAPERASLAGQPKSTAQMAAMVGAQNPQEVAEYNLLMEALNGPRLHQARLASLAGRPAPADASQIPVDLEAFNLFVPNLFYLRDHQGQTRRLDLNDACSAKNWAGADGLTLARQSEQNPEGTFVDGQYFPSRHRLLVQSQALSATPDSGHGDTTLHEFGHALETIVEALDPGFYGPWQAQVQQAFERAPSGISEYASQNPREYVAEGLAHYFEDPAALKAKDQSLFQLTEQFVHHARTLTR